MARITNDPMGAISGMIGPTVFYTVKGKQYIRAAIREREKDSWSPGQVTYRQKVSKAAAFWGKLAANPARESWKLAADGMSGYNLFLKTNLPAFKGDGSQMDLAWLHLSAGKLPLPHQLIAVAGEGDPTKWNVSWQDDSGNALAQSDDELMVIFAQDGKFTNPLSTGVKRKQKKAVVQAPQGTIQGMYLFFASADGKLYSVDQFVRV